VKSVDNLLGQWNSQVVSGLLDEKSSVCMRMILVTATLDTINSLELKSFDDDSNLQGTKSKDTHQGNFPTQYNLRIVNGIHRKS